MKWLPSFVNSDQTELPLNSLTAVSSVDGRYAEKTAELRNYFSEYALMRNRVMIEAEYLIALSTIPGVTHLRGIETEEKTWLRDLYRKFDLESAERIKEIDNEVNHDVKAVEYFVKEKMRGTSLEDCVESVHFALTSEDVTNLAYANMIKGAMNDVMLKELFKIEENLINLAVGYSSEPMLGRTHGQPAVPTTVGKEFAVYVSRLAKGIKNLIGATEGITGKLAGAVGNYNAHVVAYSDVDWMKFSEEFVHNLGFKHKPVTTQINTHDELASLLNKIQEVNNVLTDLAVDNWLYISNDYFKQKVEEGEVGSSTMPQKVNPIDFENSEGNLLIANGILHKLSSELPRSRLQRDLCDSTMLRALGEAFGHSLIAYKSTYKGLGKIEPNLDFMRIDLAKHMEVEGEAIQTILRREGVEGAFEKVKELMRGKELTIRTLETFIFNLDVDDSVKKELRNISPLNYIGKAIELTDKAVEEVLEMFYGR